MDKNILNEAGSGLATLIESILTPKQFKALDKKEVSDFIDHNELTDIVCQSHGIWPKNWDTLTEQNCIDANTVWDIAMETIVARKHLRAIK